MLKGFIGLLIIGVAFAYFVFNFVGDVENDDITNHYTNVDGGTIKEWEKKYYQTDDIGEQVLDFSNTPIKTAKRVWDDSPLKKEMLSEFPDFESMKEYIKTRLLPSPFQKYLLKKLNDTESSYLSGSIDANEAKSKIIDL